MVKLRNEDPAPWRSSSCTKLIFHLVLCFKTLQDFMFHRCRLHLVSTQLNIDERILNSGEVGHVFDCFNTFKVYRHSSRLFTSLEGVEFLNLLTFFYFCPHAVFFNFLGDIDGKRSEELHLCRNTGVGPHV